MAVPFRLKCLPKFSMSAELTLEIYSPASVLGIFNNALRLPPTVNLILIKGRYAFGGGKAYGSYYYDLLYSESDNGSIGIKIPALLRSKIKNNEIYTLKGFIDKNVKNSSIQLVFMVDEIISEEERKVSEEDLKRFDLVQRKLALPSKNLETLIRQKLLAGAPVKIANIYGHNAIVQSDFAEGLDVSRAFFTIEEFTCNITSATSILAQLKKLSPQNFDVIALVRGGGDKQSFDAFNDLLLAEEFITLPQLTVTAIGHTVDETLIDQLSDRKFNLPHDYGNSLHRIIEKLNEEKSNSRAVLIDEVKKDVTKQFAEQVKTLTEQLAQRNKEFAVLQETAVKQLREHQEHYQHQLKQKAAEMSAYQKEIALLHDRNLKAALQSETAALQAKVMMANQGLQRLQAEIDKRKVPVYLYFILLAIGLLLGYVLAMQLLA